MGFRYCHDTVIGSACYYFYGRTSGGRYIYVVLLDEGQGVPLPITARDMTDRERRYYERGGNFVARKYPPDTDNIDELARFFDETDSMDLMGLAEVKVETKRALGKGTGAPLSTVAS